MQEKKVVLLCLVGALASLAMLYFVALNFEAREIGAGEISADFVGKTVKIQGAVSGFRESRGSWFFDLVDSGRKVPVVMWSDTVEQLELSGMNIDRIKNGAKLQITGVVDSYKGKVQVAAFGFGVKILNKV